MKQIETDYKLTTPSREEIEFYVREGKRLQSEVFTNMLKSTYHIVMKIFYPAATKQKKAREKTVTPLSGHHAHSN
ncbi:MAG: hypothetical protein HKP56_13475 [Anderseniella sp.]|nr:hypothetical protein [Anderseniella sp.]